jgi:hypothetical protein
MLAVVARAKAALEGIESQTQGAYTLESLLRAEPNYILSRMSQAYMEMRRYAILALMSQFHFPVCEVVIS